MSIKFVVIALTADLFLNPKAVNPRFLTGIWLGQKSCRTKVFRILVPNFAPNFAPNCPRIFRGLFALRFVGDGDQKKFPQNPRHFSMQNSQANTKKIFTKFFWRAGKVTFGADGKRSLERAWQKRLLEKGWQRVSLHPPTLQFPTCPFRRAGFKGAKTMTCKL